MGLETYLDHIHLGKERLQEGVQVTQDWDPAISTVAFVGLANKISRHVRQKMTERGLNSSLLLFKDKSKHVIGTTYQPDFIAAFEEHWDPNDAGKVKDTKLVELAGEFARKKKKTCEVKEAQAASYPAYLLLARPELHVSHSLFVGKNKVTFFTGIGGIGTSKLKLGRSQKTDSPLPLLYALIYHLYDPGEFRDNRYKVTFNHKKRICIYELGLLSSGNSDHTEEPTFSSSYARSPYGDRTHVFVNEGADSTSLPRVIKEQYYSKTSIDTEKSILEGIHKECPVPGVVQIISHEVLELPVCCNTKVKHRLGLNRRGDRLTDVYEVGKVLEVVYDVLELTRYLRMHKHVLHKDISIGNILYSPEPDNHSEVSVEVEDLENKSMKSEIYFSRYLLGKSSHPHETSALLIDFNHAELLRDHSPGTGKIVNGHRIGTPPFMARSVEVGGPWPMPNIFDDYEESTRFHVPCLPPAPSLYAQVYPQRVRLFNIQHDTIDLNEAMPPIDTWRHELYHDAESTFLTLFYRLLLAKPDEPPAQNTRNHIQRNDNDLIDMGAWIEVHSGATGHSSLIFRLASISKPSAGKTMFHSAFSPLYGLFSNMAKILVVDTSHIPRDDPRSSVDYVHEALQRLILRFLIRHRDKEFMTLKIHKDPRQEDFSIFPMATESSSESSLSTADSMTGAVSPLEAQNGSKRALSLSEGEAKKSENHTRKNKRRRRP